MAPDNAANESEPRINGACGEREDPAVPPNPVAGGPVGMTVVVVVGAVVVVRVDVVVGTTRGATDVVVTPASEGVVVEVEVVEVEVVEVDVVDPGDTGLVDVVTATAEVHAGTEITLSSSVTAPFWASIRPLTRAPVSRVIEVSAMSEPLN